MELERNKIHDDLLIDDVFVDKNNTKRISII